LYPIGHFCADGYQLQLHALTPEFFQLIQATAFFLHDVDNHIAKVNDDPVSGRFAFNAQRQHTGSAGFLNNMVSDGSNVASGGTGADNHAIGDA